MVFKIVWTPEALASYLEVMEYVESEWSREKMKEFAKLVEDRIKTLSEQPEIGIMRNPNDASIRSIVLHKRVLLIYKIIRAKKQIQLSLFWNTRQNPQKLKGK